MTTSIVGVKIRATVQLDTISVSTPFIQSFTVNKTRSSISTCSASLKVRSDQMDGVTSSGKIVISDDFNGTIYTGLVRRIRIRPCFDDPSYVLLDVDGQDILSNLIGKKYTRRQVGRYVSFASITGVVRQSPRDGKFRYVKKQPYIGVFGGSVSEVGGVTSTRQISTPGDGKEANEDRGDKGVSLNTETVPVNQ